jgi:hypothetical protein
MSGYQRMLRANATLPSTKPSMPVVPRERVAGKTTAKDRKAAWMADLAARFPVTPTGRRADWIAIAQRYRRRPFMALSEIGRPLGRDHTYVLHALRTMGLYEDRQTPAWKEKAARREGKLERQRQYDREKRGVLRDAEQMKRIVTEGTFAPFNAKLTSHEVKRIRTLFDDGMERKEIARLFRVSPGLVYAIGARTKWKDLL